jgi:hypothetical protein
LHCTSARSSSQPVCGHVEHFVAEIPQDVAQNGPTSLGARAPGAHHPKAGSGSRRRRSRARFRRAATGRPSSTVSTSRPFSVPLTSSPSTGRARAARARAGSTDRDLEPLVGPAVEIERAAHVEAAARELGLPRRDPDHVTRARSHNGS